MHEDSASACAAVLHKSSRCRKKQTAAHFVKLPTHAQLAVQQAWERKAAAGEAAPEMHERDKYFDAQ